MLNAKLILITTFDKFVSREPKYEEFLLISRRNQGENPTVHFEGYLFEMP